MATKTIETVKRKNGTSYKARVRLTSYGKTIAEYCQCFNLYIDAKKWSEKIAKEADSKGATWLNAQKNPKKILISDVLLMVLTRSPTAENLKKSKRSNLKKLQSYPIAKIPLTSLTAKHLFEHCVLRCQTVKPQTVAHDLSNLSTALKDASVFFDLPFDSSVFTNAYSSLQRHGFIARSDIRTRRPNKNELKLIIDELSLNRKNYLLHIFELTLETALRRGEITKLRWQDFNLKNKTLTVRGRKHPCNSKRQTTTIPLSKKAVEILIKIPKNIESDLIFTIKSASISTNWRKLMKKLKIKDLHFHDLRAEAACRFFELGLTPVEIAKITGHRDINILMNIYLRLKVSPERLLVA
ncbi:site-specific integrase [Aliivibrio salmonicida]|uniref:Shufflon-specific DNA recombinase n=1 Tax=Aliivibrio salmonicida (strain LFI1238) TaxID=316275 RepID=B6ELL9_ALISL|nr:site-specific integrase [Aliivibrio salmonicida]AZL83846.1 site-specific integrase [Aliivibrio salmonicida]CAQ78082.1 shufflon-specific DNA recombinase [Aliivibrio salmonicida LFI1238]